MLKDQLEVISGINFNNIWNWLAGPIAGIEKWLIDHGLSHNPQGTMMIKIRDGMASFFEFQETWEFGTIMRRIFSVAGSLFIGIISVVFMTFFFLFEKGLIRKFILALVPNAYFEFIITVFLKIEKLLTNYLIGLVFQCLAIFTLSALGLSILGLKYAITIAVFAAVANLVPYLGPLAGGMFAIIIAISTNHFEDAESYSILLMKVILVFSLVKLNDDMIVQPVIFSKSVRAHPLEIFIVIFAGATLAGIVGMIAAIPVYTIIRVSALELTKGFREYHIFKLKN
jgi:predicted PurR-regulated permease PerM